MNFTPYQTRSFRFLDLLERQNWRLKVYSLLYPTKTVDDALVEAAKETALRFLPQPAVTPDTYGVGFLSVHQGQRYDFATVAYWTHETELRHQTYMRSSSTSVTLELLSAGELSLDVWDLYLLAFERDAWADHVLKEGPDLETYLAVHLEAEI